MSAWLLFWCAVAAAAALAGGVAYRARLGRLGVALAVAVPIGGGVVLAQLFERIALAPFSTWNAGRVAASVALARGFDLYATLETGAIVRVPLFVEEGELIRVDTRSGEYVSRVK